MSDTSEPVLPSGLERRPVLCARCGVAWDDTVVPVAEASGSDEGLCPACLLLTRHGEEPPVAGRPALSDPYPGEPSATESVPEVA